MYALVGKVTMSRTTLQAGFCRSGASLAANHNVNTTEMPTQTMRENIGKTMPHNMQASNTHWQGLLQARKAYPVLLIAFYCSNQLEICVTLTWHCRVASTTGAHWEKGTYARLTLISQNDLHWLHMRPEHNSIACPQSNPDTFQTMVL